MNHVAKLNWKVAMRKIKQQWECFNEDDMFSIQGTCEDREKKIARLHKFQKLQSKSLKN